MCFSCFFPWHSHWVRVTEKTCISFPLLPCTHQTRFSAQTFYYEEDCNRPKVLHGWGQKCSPCSNRLHWVAVHVSHFCQRAFLEMCQFHTYPHTSKCTTQGMFVTRGAMLTMCPTNNTGPRWMNDLITQSLLRLPGGRRIGALALCLQNSTRGRTILKALSWPKWTHRSLSVASTVNFPTNIGAQKCQVIWHFYKSPPPKISLLPSHVCFLLLS